MALSLRFIAVTLALLAVAASAQSVNPPLSERVKHIVVLMLENRAFDHMLGRFPGVNGVNGTEYNLVNSSDPKSDKVYATPNAPYVNQCDPDHGLPPTSYKIFGRTAFNDNSFVDPTMSGFVDFENSVGGYNSSVNFCNVMEGFTPDRVPIISTLASEYVLFDRFFAALPGPTWPNRLFFMSGTSAGLTETGPWYHNKSGQLFPQKTIFDQVEEAGGQWRVYYNDTPWELFTNTLAHNPQNIHALSVFFDNCRDGTLPDFAYINPRTGVNVTTKEMANDEHPDHDVALAERYLKDIYEAVRASPQWNETLFVLTYDEHGGFWDHVPTPLNVPPPGDGEASYPDPGFTFNRLGIRIPTILVSPWLPKGVIQGAPPAAQMPAANSEYDLTSIIASSRKLLGILNATPALTKRDAWAATFEHLFEQLDAPRTDCPMHLPAAPAPTLRVEDEAAQPINGLQRDIMAMHARIGGQPHPHHITRQEHVGDWLKSIFDGHRDRAAQWRLQKLNPTYTVVVQEKTNSSSRIQTSWLVSTNASVPFNTISTVISPHTSESTEYCLDSSKSPANGTKILITPCLPSINPALNIDPSQQWLLGTDATIRPWMNLDLCLTNVFYTAGVQPVFLAPCDPANLAQHYAYHGSAPGESDSGYVYFGDFTNQLSVLQ